MKKIFTLVIALVMSIGVYAQTPLTDAVDFTTTDHEGNEIHVFDILDGGQYVLIDFFYTSCQPCQNAVPKVVDAYYALGCNQHDVFFMEILLQTTTMNLISSLITGSIHTVSNIQLSMQLVLLIMVHLSVRCMRFQHIRQWFL